MVCLLLWPPLPSTMLKSQTTMDNDRQNNIDTKSKSEHSASTESVPSSRKSAIEKIFKKLKTDACSITKESLLLEGVD